MGTSLQKEVLPPRRGSNAHDGVPVDQERTAFMQSAWTSVMIIGRGSLFTRLFGVWL